MPLQCVRVSSIKGTIRSRHRNRIWALARSYSWHDLYCVRQENTLTEGTQSIRDKSAWRGIRNSQSPSSGQTCVNTHTVEGKQYRGAKSAHLVKPGKGHKGSSLENCFCNFHYVWNYSKIKIKKVFKKTYHHKIKLLSKTRTIHSLLGESDLFFQPLGISDVTLNNFVSKQLTLLSLRSVGTRMGPKVLTSAFLPAAENIKLPPA